MLFNSEKKLKNYMFYSEFANFKHSGIVCVAHFTKDTPPSYYHRIEKNARSFKNAFKGKWVSSSSGARSGTDIGDHASPNISVIRQLQKI